MKLSRAVLFLAGLMYLGFGVAFVVAPGPLAALVHLSTEHPVARTEIRAFYGGLEIGLGLFLLLCVWKSEAVRTGVLALALVAGGTVAGRVVGLVLDHSSEPSVLAILAVEAAVAGLGATACLRERRHSKEPRE